MKKQALQTSAGPEGGVASGLKEQLHKPVSGARGFDGRAVPKWLWSLMKRTGRKAVHRLGLDVVRYRERLEWPGDTDRFAYQQRFQRLEIADDWVVVDIGSGEHPFPRATILADLYLDESPHRTRSIVRDDRPFLLVDIHHLPFRDNSVDFVYCSHVLEHVDDPIKACSELVRVGRRGYIETPTFASDILFSWANQVKHRWHVVASEKYLFFFEYTERQREGIQSTAWYDLIRGYADHPLQAAYYNNLDLFNVMFCWQDNFSVVVSRLDGTMVESRGNCSAGGANRVETGKSALYFPRFLSRGRTNRGGKEVVVMEC